MYGVHFALDRDRRRLPDRPAAAGRDHRGRRSTGCSAACSLTPTRRSTRRLSLVSPPPSGENGRGGKSAAKAWPTCVPFAALHQGRQSGGPAVSVQQLPLDVSRAPGAPALTVVHTLLCVLFALLTAASNAVRGGPAAQGGRPGAARTVHARLADRRPDQAPGLAGRHRHGHRRRGGPGGRARHRADRPGAADLHHRAAAHARARRPAVHNRDALRRLPWRAIIITTVALGGGLADRAAERRASIPRRTRAG